MSDFKKRTGITDEAVANKYLTLTKRHARLAVERWNEDQAILRSAPPSDRTASSDKAGMNLSYPEKEKMRLKAQRQKNRKWKRGRSNYSSHKAKLRTGLLHLHKIKESETRTSNGGKQKDVGELEEITRSSKDLVREKRKLHGGRINAMKLVMDPQR